jgi:GTP pyrophosphokinase
MAKTSDAALSRRIVIPDWLKDKFAFLESPTESRKGFFDRVAEIFPANDLRYRLIERAYDTAEDAFRGKLRDGGDRYFEHLRATTLIAVAYLRIRDPDVIAALLLHDIVEDIEGWTYTRLAQEFNQNISDLVWWVTKPKLARFKSKKEMERKYHRNLRDAPRMAVLIKLCDRLHNLMTIWAQDPERIARKVDETHDFIMPLAEMHQLLIHEIEAVLSIIEAENGA